MAKKKTKVLNRNKLLALFFLLVILLAIPLTVFISQRQQEIRQRAATSLTYPPTSFQAISGFVYKKNGVEYLHQIVILPDGRNAFYQDCSTSQAFGEEGCGWTNWSFNGERLPNGSPLPSTFKVQSMREFVYNNGTKLNQFMLGSDGLHGYYRTNNIYASGNISYGGWLEWNFGTLKIKNDTNGTASQVTLAKGDIIANSAYTWKVGNEDWIRWILIRRGGVDAYFLYCKLNDVFNGNCSEWHNFSFSGEKLKDGSSLLPIISMRELVYNNGTTLSQFVLTDNVTNNVQKGYYRACSISGNCPRWTEWNFDFNNDYFSYSNPINEDKFGIGGEPAIATDVGATWLYAWGNGSAYVNSTDLNYCKAGKFNTFLTVGVFDNYSAHTSSAKPTNTTDWVDDGTRWKWKEDKVNAELKKKEDQYLKNPQERTDYNLLKDLVNSRSAMNKPPYTKENPDNRGDYLTKGNALESYLLIPFYATQTYAPKCSPVYQIANEPDTGSWVAKFSGQEYAQYYYLFQKRIKRYHPGAQVMMGGLLSFDPGWLNNFRNTYKTRYGIYPPVDIWNIHPYIWKGSVTETGAQYAQKAINRIIGFKNYLKSLKTGEENKPIWITEFAINNFEGELFPGRQCSNGCNNNCPDTSNQNAEWKIVSDFETNIINWLKQNGASYNIKKWFWYYGGRECGWTGVDRVGDFYKKADGTLNPPADMYKQCKANTSCPASSGLKTFLK